MPKRFINIEKATKSIGLKVRELRHAKGWTLEECEEYGWPNWRHLQQIESGRPISLSTLFRLANLFDVHPTEFLRDL